MRGGRSRRWGGAGAAVAPSLRPASGGPRGAPGLPHQLGGRLSPLTAGEAARRPAEAPGSGGKAGPPARPLCVEHGCVRRAWPGGRACVSVLPRPPAGARQRRGGLAGSGRWRPAAALTRGRSGSAAAPSPWTSRGAEGLLRTPAAASPALPTWRNLASRLLPPVSPGPGIPLSRLLRGSRRAPARRNAPPSPSHL